jgi:T5SS/PEP-CTERM-associated repeat protein
VIRVADSIGTGTANNTLTITNGGMVVVSNNVIVGNGVGSTGNVCTVTGSGSTLQVGNYITIGNDSAGCTLNRLIVSDQGTVLAATNFVIGDQIAAKGNVVTITGPGSLLQTAMLRVGKGGAFSTLTVTNQGTVVATNVSAGFYPGSPDYGVSTGNLICVSGANLYVTNAGGTGILDLRRGDMRVEGSGGTIVADQFDMTAANATNTLAFVADEDGFTTVKVNGAFTVNSQNKLTVDITALRRPGLHVLAQYGSMLTKFTDFTVTGSTRPYTLEQDTDNNKITLHVPSYGTTVMIR